MLCYLEICYPSRDKTTCVVYKSHVEKVLENENKKISEYT